MTDERVLEMIEEYMSEGEDGIDNNWVQALLICRRALLDNKMLRAEIDIMLRKSETLKDKVAELQMEVDRLKEIEWMYNDLDK